MRFLLALCLLAPRLALGQAPKLPPFETDIRAFEAQDRRSPPPKDAILFTGSSSIRFWTTLQPDFPGKVILNRGFGGAQLSDVIRYANRIIVPYRPRQVVLYVGDNDLASGLTPKQVHEQFVALFGLIRRALPNAHVTFVAIKPSPSRRALLPAVREANARIRQFLRAQNAAGGPAAGAPATTFVDVFTPMLDRRGQPRPELFMPDSLHMNPRGYVLWREKIRPALR